MAGAGYKLFTTGSVLTAAEVNTYLQEQTIMVFANAAARTTALASVLAEGMVSYLKDTDVVEIYTGAAWVSLDDPNAIQNTIVDAKGDLISATANDTPARLASSGVNGDILTVDTSTATGLKWAAPASSSPLTTKGDLYAYSTTNARLGVGNNGESLVADSSATTGLRWQSVRNQNPIINSNFSVWQRGTSFTSSGNVYGADRWLMYKGGANQTTTRQATGDTTNLPNIQYCARVQKNSGSTDNQVSYLQYAMETVDSIAFAGQTVTLSFYARRGSNYSATSNVLVANLYSGTGTDQTWINGMTGVATVISQNATLTTTWQRFSYSASVSSSATELNVVFGFTPTGTAGTNDYYEITGVQLEIGSVATAYRPFSSTYQGELAACQRYYQKFYRQGTCAVGAAISTSSAYTSFQFPVEMRVAPTVTMAAASSTNGISFLTSTGGYPGTIGTNTAGLITVNGFELIGASYTSAFTAGNGSILYVTTAQNVYTASAEL